MRFLMVLFLALVASTNLHAQTLWRDVPIGATVAEVRQKLPSATVPEKTSILADGKTEALLEIADFQLVDLDFKATFYFKNGTLDRIFLRPLEDPVGSHARTAASKLRTALVAKYGQPTGRSRAGDTEWASNGSVIILLFTQYTDSGVGFLGVNYVAPQDIQNL